MKHYSIKIKGTGTTEELITSLRQVLSGLESGAHITDIQTYDAAE